MRTNFAPWLLLGVLLVGIVVGAGIVLVALGTPLAATTATSPASADGVPVAAAAPAQAQPAAQGAAPAQITVVGVGTARGTPDTARVEIGVETEADTTADALAENNTQVQRVIDRIQQLGVAEADIQTSSFNISPTYSRDGDEITGYTVRNTVNVTIRDLAQAGDVLDEVVQVGANRVFGISFSVGDPAALQEAARADAVANARARAEQLADAAGVTLGNVLVITENVGSGPPVPVLLAPAPDTVAESVPVQSGQQEIAASVQITYELQP